MTSCDAASHNQLGMREAIAHLIVNDREIWLDKAGPTVIFRRFLSREAQICKFCGLVDDA